MPSVFLLCTLLVGSVAGARHAAQEFTKLQGVDAGAGTPLLTLLKQLHSSSDSSSRFSNSVSTWCNAFRNHKSAMTKALHRQIDEGTLMMRQISLDEERLGSELRLANATSAEKTRQLHDALDTGSFAAMEFEQEQQQMRSAIDAASNAIRLTTKQMKQGTAATPVIDAAMANNLMQLSQDQMTEAEKNILSAYVKDPKAADAVSTDSSTLLPMLVALHVRLQQDLDAAEKEHAGMSMNLSNLADHLNSSIIETRSQVAAIRMEVAQRRRERTRLDGKVTDLSTLASAVERSVEAAELACQDDASQQQELGKRIVEETNTLNGLLQQIPSGDNSDWLLTGTQGAPPTLLQVGKTQHEKDVAGQDKHHASSSTSPLEDIAQFVENPSADDAPDAHKVSTSDENLGQAFHALSKDATASDVQKWCASIMRDANIDGAVLARSMKRIKAKSHIVQQTMSEQEQDSTYAREQHKSITQFEEQLKKLAAEEEKQHHRMSTDLGANVRHLMALAGEVDHLPNSAEQQRTTQQLKALMREVENHQSLLQTRHSSFRRQFGAIVAADHVVLRLLVDDVKHNERRLARLKTEAQFLSSLSHAKATDQAFGQQYKSISEGFCAQHE